MKRTRVQAEKDRDIILSLIKAKTYTSGELYNKMLSKGYAHSSRTLFREVNILESEGLVSVEKVAKGRNGATRLIQVK